jgi:hypothetical protein
VQSRAALDVAASEDIKTLSDAVEAIDHRVKNWGDIQEGHVAEEPND